MRAPLPFTAPFLLAPMEGVTEPCFRELVLARNPPEALGGAFTEFVRVVREPLPRHLFRKHLGAVRFAAPVGLQLMGADPDAVAESARRAVEVGAPLVDLNFGCPAKGALRGCAGSALLRDPRAVEALVASVVKAVPEAPVTAKIRAGYDDDSLLEELARAVEAGGASMLTVHCRTRAEAYQPEVDWRRIARAVASVAIPVCGNGGVERHADLERMRTETGAAFVMVGRAALGDPWIFRGTTARASDAARFLLDYAEMLSGARLVPSEAAVGSAVDATLDSTLDSTLGSTLDSALDSAVGARLGARAASVGASAARVKQLLQHWTAGELVGSDAASWLRERDSGRFFERLAAIAGGARDPVLNPRPTGAVHAAGTVRAAESSLVPRSFAPHSDRRTQPTRSTAS